jgi:hypothetical protein
MGPPKGAPHREHIALEIGDLAPSAAAVPKINVGHAPVGSDDGITSGILAGVVVYIQSQGVEEMPHLALERERQPQRVTVIGLDFDLTVIGKDGN